MVSITETKQVSFETSKILSAQTLVNKVPISIALGAVWVYLCLKLQILLCEISVLLLKRKHCGVT